MEENLRKSDITELEVEMIWQARRGRMEQRRQKFEPLWRNGLRQFFQGIMSSQTQSDRPLYNVIYEQYESTLYSKDGLRFDNMKYPLMHAITMRALATELPNLPKVNFIAVGTNDQSKPAAFRHLFYQVLDEMDAYSEDFELMLGKRIFGSSIAMAITEDYDLTIDDPYFDKKTGKYDYEEKSKNIKQCLYKSLDLRHVLLHESCTKSNLSDCPYASVDEYMTLDTARQVLSKYDQEKVEAALAVPMTKSDTSQYDNFYDVKDTELARLTHYFDKIADRYHLLLNGKLINDIKNPIPRIAGRKGKDIPLAIAVQYKIPGAPYGYGDSHITTSFNQIKNLIRMMILEITQKAAKPFIAIDPLSNFDEQGFEWGQDFIRVSPRDLTVIPVQAQLQELYKLDETTDNDTIRVTGVNFNDTTNADASETARKTIIRRESQVALIELAMNNVSNSFYKRLYTLVKDDIKLHYGARLKSGEKIKVKTKGEALTRDKGGFNISIIPDFRYFDLKEQDFDFDMECDIELASIASSRELDKALASENMTAIAPIIQAFNADGLAKYLQEMYEMPDEVLNSAATAPQNQDPTAMANQGLPPEMLPPSQQADQQLQANATPQNEQLPQAA